MTIRQIQHNIFDIVFGPHKFLCARIAGKWELMDSSTGHITVYKTRARDWQAKVQAYIQENYSHD